MFVMMSSTHTCRMLGVCLFILFSSLFPLCAEYIDDQGIKRVGPPGSFSRGYRDANGVYRQGEPPPGTKVMNEKGKIVTVPEKLPLGDKAPDKYGEDSLRVIQNKVHDFSAVAKWANEYAYLLSVGPKPSTPSGLQLPRTSGKRSSASAQISDWEIRWVQNQSDASKYSSFFLAGKVKQVIEDGIILDTVQPGTSGKQTMILKNHPFKEQIADGDMMEVLALPSGSYSSKKLGQRTLRSYDFGRLATLEDSELERVSIP